MLSEASEAKGRCDGDAVLLLHVLSSLQTQTIERGCTHNRSSYSYHG